MQAEFFESGDIAIKTGAILTQSKQIILFRDNTSDLVNYNSILFKDSELTLKYESCSDIRIYHEHLLVICQSQGELLLDIYLVQLQGNLYSLKPFELGYPLKIGRVQPEDKYELVINSKNFVIYQRSDECFHLFKYDININNLSIINEGMQNLTTILSKSIKVEIRRIEYPFEDE